MPDANHWEANNLAVWADKVNAASGAITLRHPAYPYVVDTATAQPDKLRSIAAKYLSAVTGRLGLPSDLFVPGSADFKQRPSGFQLAWLPIDTGPRNSFSLTRYRDPYAPSDPIDRSVVFLAVQSRTANDATKATWSRHGIRIVSHVSGGNGQPFKVRVTSSTCSIGLADALNENPGILGIYPDFSSFSLVEFKAAIGPRILAAAGLPPGALSIDGVRVAGGTPQSALLEIYVNVPRRANPPRAPAYALTARVSVPKNGPLVGAKVLSVVKSAWVAHAQTDLFAQDPPSFMGATELVNGRPNRSPDDRTGDPKPTRLKRFRTPRNLPGAPAAGTIVTLREDLGCFEVMESRLVDPGAAGFPAKADGSLVKTVDLAKNTQPRMNDAAALGAYPNARDLFDRMRGFGFSPALYFRAASLPLSVRYRESIFPGPGKDGRTVNAQVDFDPPDVGVEEGTGSLQPLQVRFALADLVRSASRREPLGLAADPRWSWHEFGHVLLAASTGALELPFAHSVGDALAAIACDPDSKLEANPRLRGATFPWVYLNRRHDRSVFLGWSWCGTHHRQADLPAVSCNCRHKGYLSEQILSTTLFRLYRSLGGDTTRADGSPDVAARKLAADYAIYLIMRGVALLGAASALPAQTPDQFVTALVEADIGSWPSNPVAPLPRESGGCAHKLVRWAFEAQGLYASTDWNAIVDAPGNPPAVDIFIDTHRPDSDGAHKRGGYMPVSLDWKAAKGLKPWSASPDKSAWHARDDALEIKNKKLFVHVRNRGNADANGVKVRAWWTDWPGPMANVPPWTDVKWKLLTPAEIGPQNVLAGGVTTFGPFKKLPTANNVYLILAESSCDADRAITDPVADLPCAASATSILSLVAGDNNLGLRFFDNR